jgi:hypothetical protein
MKRQILSVRVVDPPEEKVNIPRFEALELETYVVVASGLRGCPVLRK